MTFQIGRAWGRYVFFRNAWVCFALGVLGGGLPGAPKGLQVVPYRGILPSRGSALKDKRNDKESKEGLMSPLRAL